MEGNWLGSWAGKWYGAGAETPEGSIAGSSSITVTASGIPSALAYILGAAGLTINGNGSLTSSGGEVSNPTLDLILAILTGRKVYDPETKLWHVFDANGIELVDTSGVLMQGLHGWLLREANQRKTTEVIVADGGAILDFQREKEKKDREAFRRIHQERLEIIRQHEQRIEAERLAKEEADKQAELDRIEQERQRIAAIESYRVQSPIIQPVIVDNRQDIVEIDPELLQKLNEIAHKPKLELVASAPKIEASEPDYSDEIALIMILLEAA